VNSSFPGEIERERVCQESSVYINHHHLLFICPFLLCVLHPRCNQFNVNSLWICACQSCLHCLNKAFSALSSVVLPSVNQNCNFVPLNVVLLKYCLPTFFPSCNHFLSLLGENSSSLFSLKNICGACFFRLLRWIKMLFILFNIFCYIFVKLYLLNGETASCRVVFCIYLLL